MIVSLTSLDAKLKFLLIANTPLVKSADVTVNVSMDGQGSAQQNTQSNGSQGANLGAVIAAEWLLNKEGVFSMKDVLNIG